MGQDFPTVGSESLQWDGDVLAVISVNHLFEFLVVLNQPKLREPHSGKGVEKFADSHDALDLWI